MSVKNFKRMAELLDDLRSSMEKQEAESTHMQFRILALRDQNEKLRKEREDLRVENAQLVARIAQLSRKNSIASSPPKPAKTKGVSPVALVRVLPQSKQESQPEHESQTSDTDYEDTTPTSSPSVSKRLPKSVTSAPSLPPPTPPPPRRTVQFLDSQELASSDLVKFSSDSQESTSSKFDKKRSESVVSTASDISRVSGFDTESPMDTVSPLSSVSDAVNVSKGNHRNLRLKKLGAIGRAQTLGASNSVDHSDEDDDWDGGQMRPRLSTVAASSSHPKPKLSSSQISSSRFHRQNSFPHRGRYKVNREHLTYLSPDVEMKIQKMIQEAIGTKYGGLVRATRAAIIIQQAYRNYRIQKQFTEIRKKQRVTLYRRRAESVKYPDRRRRPSMIGPRKYRKENSSSSADAMQRVLDTHKSITTRNMSPSISRRQLLNQSKTQLLVPRTSSASHPISEEEDTSTGSHSSPISRPPSSVVELEESLQDDVFSISSDHVDAGGLTTSISADILSQGRVCRSPSIFSSLSVQTMQELFPMEQVEMTEDTLSRQNKTNIGIHIFNRKPTRGIQYLVHERVVADDPMEVAKFIWSTAGFSKEKIGEFVGEIRQDFNVAVLECMVELIDFSGKVIDNALRKFQELFRMPGEAQKIDKIMQIFAAEYFKHNDGGVIKSEDAAYVLAFATMMLHTDLHNPAVRRHMTVQQWLSMNRGTNDDEDYPKQFLVDIYTRIQKEQFVTGQDHTNVVAEVERHLVGASLPGSLCTPQRMLLMQKDIMEVKDINKRAMINRHRRVLFLFNDMILITKYASGKYEFRTSISLLDVQAMQFSTQNYKYGICVQNVSGGEAYKCNCEKREDRNHLLKSIQRAIEDLRELEKARIRTLGSTLHTAFSDDEDGPGNLTGSRELLTSVTTSSSMQDMRNVGRELSSAAVVAPVGETTRVSPSLVINNEVKRSSKDSGFDSPHFDYPRATSPSPNGWPASSLPPQTLTLEHDSSQPARSKTPDTKRRLVVIPDRKNRTRSVTPDLSEHRLVPVEVKNKTKSLSPDSVPSSSAGKRRWRLGSKETKDSSVSPNSKKNKKVNRTASSKP